MKKDLGVQSRLYNYGYGCNLNSALLFTPVKTGHWNKQQQWDTRILQNTEQVKYSKDATQVTYNGWTSLSSQLWYDYIYIKLGNISWFLFHFISTKSVDIWKKTGHIQLVYCLNSIWGITERNGDLIWP